MAVTSDTLKFSAAFAGRKYCHSKPGFCLSGAPGRVRRLGSKAWGCYSGARTALFRRPT